MTKPNVKRWSVGQRSETGYVRSENQDRMSWIRAPACNVFVVSDGMGGHAGGAIAAGMTVQVLQDELSATASLEQAADALERGLQAANAAVYARGQSSDPSTAGMGATAVVLLTAGERIMLAHVGDSRAYLFSRRGALRRLTKDHSVVQRMIDAGALTEEEAAIHPDASVLERAIGQAPHVAVEVSEWLAVQPGDVCMLCSDGLCGYVGDDEIAAAMRSRQAPQEQADRLAGLALERGGEDNVTVQVIRYGKPAGFFAQRWIGRGAYALAAVFALVAAAVAGAQWLGVRAERFAIPTDRASASGRTPVATDAPVTMATAPAELAPAAQAGVAPERVAALEARVATLEQTQPPTVAPRSADESPLAQEVTRLRAQVEALSDRIAAASSSSVASASGTKTAAAANPTAKNAQKPATASPPKKPLRQAARPVAKTAPASEEAPPVAASQATGAREAATAPVPEAVREPPHEPLRAPSPDENAHDTVRTIKPANGTPEESTK